MRIIVVPRGSRVHVRRRRPLARLRRRVERGLAVIGAWALALSVLVVVAQAVKA